MSQSTQQKILELFQRRRGGYLSGEQISNELGVSRTAVWKQIKLLRDSGYRIDAVPSRGYRLVATPDLLHPAEIQAGLVTERVASRVVYLEQTDSTNLQLRQLAKEGTPDGTVVIADRQSAGRGRLGRQWVSPPGVNLYTSVLLRPPIHPMRAPELTFVSAVAVARAITEVSGLAARVKWPNDILLEGRKVAGLLSELEAESDQVHFVILGIGVNLNMTADQFPDDLRYPATSVLLSCGEPVGRLAFARALYRQLDLLYADYLAAGFAPVRRAWESLCDLVGRPVEVDFQQRKLTGTVLGIDEQGGLLLQKADGSLETVLAGDVRPL